MLAKILLATVAAFPLIACSSTNVVMQPIGFKDVNPKLLEKPSLPSCPVPVAKTDATGAARHNIKEWQTYADCNVAAVNDFYSRLTGLQRAVVVRQEAQKKALAAAKL